MARENCRLLPALCLTVCFCLVFCTSVTAKRPHKKSTNKCPTPCLCSTENVYVRCTKVDQVPRYLPANATFLTFHNATFGEITNGTFSHFPSLHLILLKDSTFNIEGNAFKGLRKLQYLFIDNNNIQSISGNAFQGLKSLTHLSLSNNKLQSLPRDIFDDLDSLTEVDLRGNSFSCNCKNKWLVTWLQVINASIPEVYCAAPLKFSGRSIRSLQPEEFDCFATEFVEFQTLHMHSYSVESYIYHGDVNVVLAQPRVGKCTFLEWDHVEGLFRVFDNITGQAVISCKPVVIDDQLVVIMAQLVGGSHIYKRDEHSRRFLKIQDIDRDKIRKPSDVETFQIEGEQYAIITDSSKAGVTTLYRWNGNGFYSQQSLHHWYRDTDGELVHILGGDQLVLTSSSQLPVLYEWDREQGLFSQGPHTNIPDVEDAVTVRSFTHAGQLYLCLTRYIGDSKVMKWSKSSFQEVQTMPSRGSMLLQPFHVGLRQYGVLGSDFAFSQVFRWDADIDAFVKLQELNVQAPRAFTVVSVGKEDFLFASSFTSKTVIYRHHVVDTSL